MKQFIVIATLPFVLALSVFAQNEPKLGVGTGRIRWNAHGRGCERIREWAGGL